MERQVLWAGPAVIVALALVGAMPAHAQSSTIVRTTTQADYVIEGGCSPARIARDARLACLGEANKALRERAMTVVVSSSSRVLTARRTPARTLFGAPACRYVWRAACSARIR
jgi:hypothetical protein